MNYAIIEKSDQVTVYKGDIRYISTLKELNELSKTNAEIVFLTPFNSIKEKDFVALGDEPIVALIVNTKETYNRLEYMNTLPDTEIILEKDIVPSISDIEFADMVEKIQANEIKEGNASQIIVSRIFKTKIKDMSEQTILSLYKRLLALRGQYMTFVFKYNSHFFIGATPEKHLEITDTATTMIPIAGTLKKGDKNTFIERLKGFLKDQKEINELFQVLDEEMKMMARICPSGGKIMGPFLRDSGAVIHTEYELHGHKTHLEPIDAFKHTLHAPTLVGSPIENACRIIAKYEKVSRRYYGGEIGVITKTRLDSAIIIRTAEINRLGEIRIQAGSGIVLDSDPMKEALENRAKSQGLCSLLKGKKGVQPYITKAITEEITTLLSSRSTDLSRFHCDDQSALITNFKNIKITIINNEDNFAYVLQHILIHMGLTVEVIDTFEYKAISSDIVVIGPGPGDINDISNERMVSLKSITKNLLSKKIKTIGICLGHQAICDYLGLPIKKQDTCTQGMIRTIKVFGQPETLGFYNSFSPVSKEIPFIVDKDEMGRIITIKDTGFIGMQFHPESVMTKNGYKIIEYCINHLIKKP